MRDLLFDLRHALEGVAESMTTSPVKCTPAPASRHGGGRPKGAIGKRWRSCLRAVCGPDGAGTFGISDISRTYGKPITGSAIQRELGTLIQAGHIALRTASSFQITEQGLAMLHGTKLIDEAGPNSVMLGFPDEATATTHMS